MRQQSVRLLSGTIRRETDEQCHAGSTAALEQAQFITQKNVNKQHAAIAVAEDGGSADATQVTMQENENVQFTALGAMNIQLLP